MKPSFVWLVVPIFGLQTPAFAQDDTANQQAADKVCVAERPTAGISAFIKDRKVLCGEDTPSGSAEQGLWPGLCGARPAKDDRSYLLETASPSATMMLQGPQT